MKKKVSMFIAIFLITLVLLFILTGCSNVSSIENEVVTRTNYSELANKYVEETKASDDYFYFAYACTYYISKDGLSTILNFGMTDEEREIETFKSIEGKTIKKLKEEGKKLMKENNITVNEFKKNLENMSNQK